MKVYLVDFENVKSKGLTGIEHLDAEDRVIIFYSENSDTISFEMHRKVLSCTAQIEYLKVKVGGKNALDFQLATLLGYLVSENNYSHIFVISSDKGFDKLHDFWNESYKDKCFCTVFRMTTIASAINFYITQTGGRKFITATPEEPETEVESPATETADTYSAEQDASQDISQVQPVEEQTEEVEVAVAVEPEPEQVSQIQQEASADNTLPIEILNEEINGSWTAPAEHSENTVYADSVTIEKFPVQKRNRPVKPVAVQIKNSLTGFFDLSLEEIEDIKNYVAQSETKEDFHNLLAKQFKNQSGDLYKILRPKYLKFKEQLEAEADKLSATENKAVVEAEQTAFNDEKIEVVETVETASEPTVEENKPKKASKPKAKTAKKKPAQKAKKSENKKPAPKAENSDKSVSPALFNAIEKLLKGHCSDEEISTVVELMAKAETKQRLYLSMVKQYKKDRGCEIYKIIKPEYSNLEKLRETAENRG